MIREVTIYEVGGVRFDTIEEAVKHSALCEKVEEIMNRLLPRTPMLENGEGVVFHDKNVVAEVLDDFAELVTERLSSKFHFVGNKNDIYRAPNSIIELLMGDKEGHCLLPAYQRLLCLVPQLGMEVKKPKQAQLLIEALVKGEVL